MISIPPGTGYDRAITMFDPKGRIFQVEYAMKAVRHGKPCIGVRYKDGVVLVVQRLHDPLQEEDAVKKTFILDDHVFASFAGITADARVLLEEGRVQAQNYMLTYDVPINIESLTRYISDIMQSYTQHGGVRPFGVALLIAGIDETGSHLFMTYPSGSYWEFKAAAIGKGMSDAMKYLQKRYVEVAGGEENDALIATRDEAILLALETLFHINKWEKLESRDIEIGYVDMKDKKVTFLEKEKSEEYLKKALAAKEKEREVSTPPEEGGEKSA